MTFVQVIDYETEEAERFDALMDDWLQATEGKRTATHSSLGKDRDNPTHFMQMVEFPSYESAMRNSELPATRHIAEEMQHACITPPRFVNLEIVRDERI